MIGIKNITKRFGALTVINNLSLDIKAGEFHAILGKSGEGKSTLLGIISGMINPDSGTVTINSPHCEDILQNRPSIGYVFQDNALFPHLSLFENVAYGLRASGCLNKEIIKRVKYHLELTGLEECADRRPHELSGGQRQRAGLARALILNPHVLLLDEPFSNSDANLHDQLLQELKQIHRNNAMTMVYVTHNRDEAYFLADRISVLHKGRIEQSESSENIFTRPNTCFVASFVGVKNVFHCSVERILDDQPLIVVGCNKEHPGLKFRVENYPILEKERTLEMCVHPSKVQVSNRREGGNSYPGIVQAIAKKLNGSTLRIQMNGLSIEAIDHSNITYRAGDLVWVTIPSDAFHPLCGRAKRRDVSERTCSFRVDENKVIHPKEVVIYDTTLRDGEQAPGFTMTVDEKIHFAGQLINLGVDVIEAGFPVASHGDHEAISRIAEIAGNTTVSALARASIGDIDCAWNALNKAAHSRIHIFMPASDIQITHQLRSNRFDALERAVHAVSYAKKLTHDVQFSAMDGTRADREYLGILFERVIGAGANVINISDTVGCITPFEMHQLINMLRTSVKNIGNAAISVHCHNDLGLAVANSLLAVQAGADQVECTINGIGERGGNAALEEFIMALEVKKEILACRTNIKTDEIVTTSTLLSHITGVPLPPNKPVVGANAFLHQSGIHQDGVIKNPATYEPYDPQKIGLCPSRIALGKHSGRSGLIEIIKQMDIDYETVDIDAVMGKIKTHCDYNKKISKVDLASIISENFL